MSSPVSSIMSLQRRHMCSEIRRFRLLSLSSASNVSNKEIDSLGAVQKDTDDAAKKTVSDNIVPGKYMCYYTEASIQKYYAATGSTSFVDGEYMSWATNENLQVAREKAKAAKNEAYVWRGLSTF